jgi:hypothetical protein
MKTSIHKASTHLSSTSAYAAFVRESVSLIRCDNTSGVNGFTT